MRDWHGTGQTGCLFARRLSDVASHSAWPAVVFLGGDPVDLSRQVRDLAEPALHEAIVRPDCELVSFLFPGVSTVLGLREVCDLLVANTGITLSEDRSNAGVSLVTLRLGISGEDTLSWVMGFGPFVNWPATRQAPVLEFAIRVKPKPESLFHKLNQDSTAAHLADSDPRLTESQMEKVFDRTERTTRDVLGAAPDFRSAAKVTFSFPSRLWDAALPG